MYVGVQMSRARITRLVAVGPCLKLRGGPLAGWTQGVETMRGYLKSKHGVVVAAAGATLEGCGGVMPDGKFGWYHEMDRYERGSQPVFIELTVR